MPSENSLSQTHDVAERLELLRAASEGKLDGLTCPRCARPCVSVWFTHPSEREYRTWFICGNCGFEMRAQNTGRPPHYSKERDPLERPTARADILQAMREMAERGTTVRELVREIHARLGYQDEAVVPVLWYFTQAFGLPLKDVLPIREWMGTDRDDEINALIVPALKRPGPSGYSRVPNNGIEGQRTLPGTMA